MMNQQQKTDPGTAKPDNTDFLDALITRAHAGNDTASLTSSASLPSAEIASNSAIMNILIQQELQKRALLGNLGLAGVHLSMSSVPNSVQNGGAELLHSLLLQRSMLHQQQQQQFLGRVLPPTSSGLGLGLPVMNSTASLLNHDALSTNGLLQLLQQRQQPGSQQMLPSSVSGLPSGKAKRKNRDLSTKALSDAARSGKTRRRNRHCCLSTAWPCVCYSRPQRVCEKCHAQVLSHEPIL
jgi:hypothetical protein